MSFQRLLEAYTTSLTSYRRLKNVETTSCVYWDCEVYQQGHEMCLSITGKTIWSRDNFGFWDILDLEYELNFYNSYTSWYKFL